EALAAIAQGPDGILAGLGPGKAYVDMSTVSPKTSRELSPGQRARGPHARRTGLGQPPPSRGRDARDHGRRRGGSLRTRRAAAARARPRRQPRRVERSWPALEARDQ